MHFAVTWLFGHLVRWQSLTGTAWACHQLWNQNPSATPPQAALCNEIYLFSRLSSSRTGRDGSGRVGSVLDWAGLKLCRWQRECMAMSPTKDYWIASQPASQSQLAAGKMEIGKMLCFTFNLKCKHINISLFAARALPTCGCRLTNSFRMLYGLHVPLH